MPLLSSLGNRIIQFYLINTADHYGNFHWSRWHHILPVARALSHPGFYILRSSYEIFTVQWYMKLHMNFNRWDHSLRGQYRNISDYSVHRSILVIKPRIIFKNTSIVGFSLSYTVKSSPVTMHRVSKVWHCILHSYDKMGNRWLF